MSFSTIQIEPITKNQKELYISQGYRLIRHKNPLISTQQNQTAEVTFDSSS
ncbi:hypothetical protein GPEL0_01f4201 [Geoanaerobacter pelophilus]|uniref:Uncharacterized protein n=1 Tax=Geoanaerobacter pelophilus TaxID=60036 RepID=A0ABQ0MLU7_9BACT|nr:hypothetical protein GPEL0_01f4201 [Geoanaerobacter pelophilus]